MRKKSSTNKFIQTCYYKLRAHRSVSNIKPNPLLIPNAAQDNTLCAFSMKKSSRNYHHKTITDWQLTSSIDYSRLKKMKKNKENPENNKNMEDMIVVCKVQTSLQHSKLESRVKQVKRERFKIFKANKALIEDQLGNKNNNMKNLHLSSNQQFRQTQKIGKKPDNQSQNQINRNSMIRLFPSRPNHWKSFENNESVMTVRGWQSDSAEQQEGLNLSTGTKFRIK